MLRLRGSFPQHRLVVADGAAVPVGRLSSLALGNFGGWLDVSLSLIAALVCIESERAILPLFAALAFAPFLRMSSTSASSSTCRPPRPSRRSWCSRCPSGDARSISAARGAAFARVIALPSSYRHARLDIRATSRARNGVSQSTGSLCVALLVERGLHVPGLLFARSIAVRLAAALALARMLERRARSFPQRGRLLRSWSSEHLQAQQGDDRRVEDSRESEHTG